MTSATLITRARRVSYPESDGRPIGESDLHRDLMSDLIFALKWYLGYLRAYVAGNLIIYFEEGNPKAFVAPDVFVVMGVQQRRRRIYCSWKEDGRLPNVVIELTSKGTREADQNKKPALYARLGVQEYFQFDPFGEYLHPQLQGYRLVHGVYVPISEYPLRSTVLGLELREEDNALRLYNPVTGRRLPTSDEEVLARRDAEAAPRRPRCSWPPRPGPAVLKRPPASRPNCAWPPRRKPGRPPKRVRLLPRPSSRGYERNVGPNCPSTSIFQARL